MLKSLTKLFPKKSIYRKFTLGRTFWHNV